jgi:hypothetical protein
LYKNKQDDVSTYQKRCFLLIFTVLRSLKNGKFWCLDFSAICFSFQDINEKLTQTTRKVRLSVIRGAFTIHSSTPTLRINLNEHPILWYRLHNRNTVLLVSIQIFLKLRKYNFDKIVFFVRHCQNLRNFSFLSGF